MSIDVGQTEHLKSWIGREKTDTDTLTPRLITEFNATLHGLVPEPSAGATHLGIHWVLGPQIADTPDLGSDGHPRTGDFLPPVPLPRRMWAGGEVRFLSELREGDRVERRSRVSSVDQKNGKSGSLWFVAVDHETWTGRGLAATERQDIVYREMAAGPTPSPTAREQKEYTTRRTISLSEVLLFRYSAMTFNGHRIHYDIKYARDREHYPGLVVHGPLQATILMNEARRLLGRSPSVFSYRSVSPLILESSAEIVSEAMADKGLSLSVLNASGVVTMAAIAQAFSG
ncbi:MaoC family dehydratase N-terminal domain-containing protein (plasmid) [Rhizobium sp. 32-5/1]|uniref:FAS1-like dehydratase domain-containing protein n=1 Tax=Rhizobium sp. 32-5/1 TaxID=3019602 RepID=UPI00240DC7DD|nr:MaoC family dehydratase N-terminal domain-containing protein [Rhizobium sp. 32-5/1]WEZ85470.1 MaoC family dehydratase N-terminal domain-containing protein [Rhizobium sp. 32-5/1]